MQGWRGAPRGVVATGVAGRVARILGGIGGVYRPGGWVRATEGVFRGKMHNLLKIR